MAASPTAIVTSNRAGKPLSPAPSRLREAWPQLHLRYRIVKAGLLIYENAESHEPKPLTR